MEKLIWDDATYSVGLTKIDEQHKVLVQLINTIVDKQNRVDRNFLNKIINTLIMYTEKHFRDEERVMRNIGFPFSAEHQKLHLKFEEQVKKTVERYHDEGDQAEILEKIVEFLQEWITSHILIQDIEYKKYIYEGVEES